ncbi:hypothetical protein CCR75_006171 [Bremia lactucae]|uniref:Uncharacterized protein n=1 Tax=Bremia lactucae TaxID=4779 RepID=A0A976IJK1_BRELC|nr:hypothetical protein CCR75_006171 [Bremia lactucae]
MPVRRPLRYRRPSELQTEYCWQYLSILDDEVLVTQHVQERIVTGSVTLQREANDIQRLVATGSAATLSGKVDLAALRLAQAQGGLLTSRRIDSSGKWPPL